MLLLDWLKKIKKVVSYVNSLIFTRENAVQIGGAAALTVTNIGVNFIAPYVLGESVNALETQEPASVGSLEFSPMTGIILYGAAFTISSCIPHLRSLTLASTAPRATKKLVLKYFNNIMNQSMSNYKSDKQIKHILCIYKCYSAVPSVGTEMFTQILPTTIEITLAIALLSAGYGIELGLGLAGILSLFMAYSLKNTSNIIDLRQTGFDLFGEFQNEIDASLKNYETIHVLNQLSDTIRKVDDILNKVNKQQRIETRNTAGVGVGQTLLSGAGLATLCALVVRGVLAGRYSISDLITINSYLIRFIGPLNALGASACNFFSSVSELDYILRQFEKTSEIIDHNPDRKLTIHPEKPIIEFKNVNFNYTEWPELCLMSKNPTNNEIIKNDLYLYQENNNIWYATIKSGEIIRAEITKKEFKHFDVLLKTLRDMSSGKFGGINGSDEDTLLKIASKRGHTHDEGTPISVLNNVSFVINPGEKIGLVGPSGSGKTTIENLIARFFEPKQGAILISGQDTREVSLRSLRDTAMIVPQHPVFFNDTLYKNTVSGKENITREQVLNILIFVGLEDYVNRHGLDKKIGEKGDTLSGGEKKRLGVARALLSNPSIIIFDEITAGLDNVTKHQLQTNLDQICQSRGITSIHIVHDYSNLINANRIFVLNKGRIIEQGTHNELIQNKNSLYVKLTHDNSMLEAEAKEETVTFHMENEEVELSLVSNTPAKLSTSRYSVFQRQSQNNDFKVDMPSPVPSLNNQNQTLTENAPTVSKSVLSRCTIL
jgi:ABC-type multidrug transport system fused ATPase/permease subunit